MTSIENRIVSVALPPFGAEGSLALPAAAARGIILFAQDGVGHRSGPRNAGVAAALQGAGFATLVFDLLSHEEAKDPEHGLDIPLLSDRLDQAATWVRAMAAGRDLPLGFFGTSSGAAAALFVAASRDDVHAIVSCNCCPELTEPALARVTAATLLIVGSNDPAMLASHQGACCRLHCMHRLEVVALTADSFEGPDTLAPFAVLAKAWFLRHMTPCLAEANHAVQ